MMAKNDDEREVGKLPRRPNVKTGKPKRVATTAMRVKFATGGLNISGLNEGAGGNFYSPELSTDFLELPQSQHEQWAFYRYFARNEAYVAQALDLHTELPLSKVRIGMPKAKSRVMALAATRFVERWAKERGLLHRLIEIVYDYHLIGIVHIFAEDGSPEMPESVRFEKVRTLNEDGIFDEQLHERKDANQRAVAWLKKNYRGWTDIRVLPPEQVHIENFQFTSEKIIELIPDAKSKDIVQKAEAGDPQAQRIANSMSTDVVQAIREGRNVPLNTDPDAGSFVYVMARKKSQYESVGHSILERCIRSLVFKDKIRQAATSIASRHMTPIRVITAPDADEADLDAIREQVDMSLADPDFSIVTNFELQWNEMGAQDRLPDWSNHIDMTNRDLYAGLGVTEGLLTGESSYSGDRINLEVINTRYMLMRELLQDFVEEYLFKPMCRRMGFIEEDEDGNEVVIYPKLSFTRLALRDNSDTFDALFNLYNKGSLDIDTILELLNIDPVTTREKLERDSMTFNDAVFNEVLRGLYGRDD